jgi:hypothetical protein
MLVDVETRGLARRIDATRMMRRMIYRIAFLVGLHLYLLAAQAPTFSRGKAETPWLKVTVAPEKSSTVWIYGLTAIPAALQGARHHRG